MLWKAILLQFLRFAISQNTKIKCCAPLLKHTTKTRNKTSYKSFILPGIVSNITWYIYAKENLLNHYSCTLKLYFDIFSFFVLFQAQTATLTIAQAFNLAFDKWKQESYCCLLLKFCKCSSLFRFILQDLSYIFLESLNLNIYADVSYPQKCH